MLRTTMKVVTHRCLLRLDSEVSGLEPKDIKPELKLAMKNTQCNRTYINIGMTSER